MPWLCETVFNTWTIWGWTEILLHLCGITETGAMKVRQTVGLKHTECTVQCEGIKRWWCSWVDDLYEHMYWTFRCSWGSIGKEFCFSCTWLVSATSKEVEATQRPKDYLFLKISSCFFFNFFFYICIQLSWQVWQGGAVCLEGTTFTRLMGFCTSSLVTAATFWLETATVAPSRCWVSHMQLRINTV